jgi:hypothetical protein
MCIRQVPKIRLLFLYDVQSDQQTVYNSLLLTHRTKKTVTKSVSAQPKSLNATQIAMLDADLGWSHPPTCNARYFCYEGFPLFESSNWTLDVFLQNFCMNFSLSHPT